VRSFEARKLPVELARALIVSAQCARERGKPEAALRFLDRASRAVKSTTNTLVPLEIRVEEAAVRARRGQFAAARRLAEEVVRRSADLELVELNLDARRVLGEIRLQQNDRAAASLLLQSVRDEAARRGFALIARRAGEALAR
jgi:tetratricopeptide (TPR) repeat protein